MKKSTRFIFICIAAAAALSSSSCRSENPEKTTASAAATTSAAARTTFPPFSSATPVITESAETETEVAEALPHEEDIEFIHKLGTAGELSGTTVIVSVFASDAITAWDDSDTDDAELQKKNLKALKTAAEWITDQCREYGREADFVCDWEENSDLYCRVRFTDTLVRFDAVYYDMQKQYILNEIDSRELKRKYNAENIIYVFFFNTSYRNQINPWSLTYQIDPIFDVELINSFVRFKGFDAPPATYAHEILHCFGAYDLYYASDAVPQSYVDYCTETGSQDVMYTVNSGNEITVTLSELDAYYVGLVDSCGLVEEWGLAKSQH